MRNAVVSGLAAAVVWGNVTVLLLAHADSSCTPELRRELVELLKAHRADRETGKAATDDPGVNELRGSWKVTDAPRSAPTRLTFDGNEIIIFITDNVKAERRFKVDPKAR